MLATCVAYGGDQLPIITWLDGNDLLTNDSEITIYEYTIVEGGLNFTVSILEVCSVTTLNSGVYSCVATNANDSSIYTDIANFTIDVRSGKYRYDIN